MARLEIRKLKKVSRVEITDAPLSIGRSSRNGIVLRDDSVSRSHCTIEIVDGTPHIRDCESHTGTFVNSVRITQVALRHGDRISIGPFDLLFCDPAAADVEPSTAPADSADARLAAQTAQLAELTAAAAQMHCELQEKSNCIASLQAEIESLVQRQRNTEATRQTALERVDRAEQRLVQLIQNVQSLDEAARSILWLQNQLADAEQRWLAADQSAPDDQAALHQRDALSASLDSLHQQRDAAVARLQQSIQQLRSTAERVQSPNGESAAASAAQPSTHRWWRFGARRHV